MKMLVTGGAGFIGSHLVDRLVKEEHDVYVIDNLSQGKKEQVNADAIFIENDIQNIDQVRELDCFFDVIFHLAAQISVPFSHENPSDDARSNIMGTIALLDFARKHQVKRFVFTSSGGGIYGQSDQIPTLEKSKVNLFSPYSISKYCGEQYVKYFANLHNFKYTIFRPSNVYGSRQDGSQECGVIAIFSRLAKQGLDLTVDGDGQQTRDFVNVQDVVRAYLAAFQSENSGIYNISSNKEYSIRQLIEILESIKGEKLTIIKREARPNDVIRSCLDNGLALKELGWSPQIELKQGLQKL